MQFEGDPPVFRQTIFGAFFGKQLLYILGLLNYFTYLICISQKPEIGIFLVIITTFCKKLLLRSCQILTNQRC